MKVRAINLSLFLIVFFVMMGFFDTLQPFGGGMFKTSSEVINSDDPNVNENVSSYLEETLLEAAEGQMNEYTEGDIGAIFSFGILGAKVLITVFVTALRYIFFMADVLIAWGAPLIVALLIQMLVYITYALSIYETFVKR